MAYLKVRELRGMNAEDRENRLKELRQELMHERGVSAMGGSPPSPGKIRQLRRQIARILTLQREDQLGIPNARAAAAPTKKPAGAPTPAKAAAARRKA